MTWVACGGAAPRRSSRVRLLAWKSVKASEPYLAPTWLGLGLGLGLGLVLALTLTRPYLAPTSVAKPPPSRNERTFMSSDSWLPRLKWMVRGAASISAKITSRISTACLPRSATSPLIRYLDMWRGARLRVRLSVRLRARLRVGCAWRGPARTCCPAQAGRGSGGSSRSR